MADVVKKATRHGYNEGLVELAAKHEDIICLDADLGHATGSLVFREAYPERYIETGIAEQQLSHYANGQRHPRPAMQQRITAGILAISRRLAVIL